MHLISKLCVALTLTSTCIAQTAPAAGGPPHAQRKVAILVYPGVELLDFAGPGEVFAGTHADKFGAGFEVYTVAETRAPLSSMGFVQITPQFSIADCPKPDVVVIPGGNVPSDNDALIAWVKARSKDTEVVMSVCNGALLLGKAGLLAGLEVTTHKSALQNLAMIEPTAKVFTNRRFVDNGRIVTAAGISAGIDGALHLVARLQSEDTAWATARYMEYDWRPDEIAKLHEQPGRQVDKSQATTLASSFRGLGSEAALAKYKGLEKPPTEAELNAMGYSVLNVGRHEDALTLFTLATFAFPSSANASDSLSEAYELCGNVEQSKTFARQTLSLLDKEKDRPEKNRQAIRNSSSSRLARFAGKQPAEFPFKCGPCGNRCDKLGYLEDGSCPGCGMALEARTKSE
ncbi:MAG TPA: DJ-1/PfpI family protein [Planctomycetota bacterium]|nr:DJ-1/PfpI family protein [Planctomycetota bacterium]